MTSILSPHGEVFAVADGMGGHKGGAQAARIACETIERIFRELKTGVPVKSLIQTAVEHANREIYAIGTSGDPATAGAGSTLVLTFFERYQGNYQLWVAHIGDSRAYLFREGKLTRLTRDHSTVQRLLDDGLITAAQARSHPDAGVLVRALGKQAAVEADFGNLVALKDGDVVLLCSDGLCGFVDDSVIAQVLTASFIMAPQELANRLIEEALREGSNDNITVQVVRLGDVKRHHRSLARDLGRETFHGLPVRRSQVRLAALTLLFASAVLAGIFAVKWVVSPPRASPQPAGQKDLQIAPVKSDPIREVTPDPTKKTKKPDPKKGNNPETPNNNKKPPDPAQNNQTGSTAPVGNPPPSESQTGASPPKKEENDLRPLDSTAPGPQSTRDPAMPPPKPVTLENPKPPATPEKKKP